MKNTFNTKGFLAIGLVIVLGAFAHLAHAQVSSGDDDSSSSVAISNGGDDSSSGSGSISNGGDDSSSGSITNGNDDSSSGSITNGNDDQSGGSISNGNDDSSSGSITNGNDDSSGSNSGGDNNDNSSGNGGSSHHRSSSSSSNTSSGAEEIADSGNAAPVAIEGNCVYLTAYSKLGGKNNPDEVRKLQTFLNNHEHISLTASGIFDTNTFEAVKAFQAKYLGDVMGPWGASIPSGQVYITTTKKINELYCSNPFPLSAHDLAVIEAYKKAHSGAVIAKANPTTTPKGSFFDSTASGSPVPVVSPSTDENTNLNTAAAAESVPSKIGNFFKRIFNFILGK